MEMVDSFARLKQRLPKHPNPRTRLIFLLLGIACIAGLSWYLTGSVVPEDAQQANIFQGGILLVIFGSLFLEDKFTKPADAVVNAITAIISLIPVYGSLGTMGLLILAYCILVGLSGITNLAFGVQEPRNWLKYAKKLTYQVSTVFGKSNVIFSIVFLYAVFSFYDVYVTEAALLVVFWGLYIAMWPLKIPHIVQALFSKQSTSVEKGTIVRVDSPGLIRVRLNADTKWQGPMVACLGDGTKRKVVPLYTQVQDEQVIGTGLLQEAVELAGMHTQTGTVYDVPEDSVTAEDESKELPVGFVVEGSKIAKIYFETWRPGDLCEGKLVFCMVRDERVFYQVIDAATSEEAFEHHKHGFQVVEAHQLGTLNPKGGFKKFTWVPEMNTPVFLAGSSVQGKPLELPKNQMCLGFVPGSDVQVICDIDEMILYHTAILGVTGSGKTELAYTIIQYAIENGVKVFCVDITGQYSTRLCDFKPKDLSISKELAHELGQKIHAVETGEYRAGKEKGLLKTFATQLSNEIGKNVRDFLTSDDNLAIFTLQEISNTKTTIFATELYLSNIFDYGREHYSDSNKKRILIVLEEAHTVIPESSTMGLGDYDSRGMVAKIAQIALQGRKYDVGLLVIAQRTATVSKTVLTQCNTTITFASFDQTGLDFLENIYGSDHTSRISNLPFLHALVFGKGIKSERPIIVQIPEKPELLPPKPADVDDAQPTEPPGFPLEDEPAPLEESPAAEVIE